MSGASLVPCVGFGENEMYFTVDNQSPSFFAQQIYKVQTFLMKRFTFSFPIMTHLLPLREKVTVVVGSPIHLDKLATPEPSQELVDKVHKQYCDEIVKLYNDHKEYYGKNIPIELV